MDFPFGTTQDPFILRAAKVTLSNFMRSLTRSIASDRSIIESLRNWRENNPEKVVTIKFFHVKFIIYKYDENLLLSCNIKNRDYGIFRVKFIICKYGKSLSLSSNIKNLDFIGEVKPDQSTQKGQEMGFSILLTKKIILFGGVRKPRSTSLVSL